MQALGCHQDNRCRGRHRVLPDPASELLIVSPPPPDSEDQRTSHSTVGPRPITGFTELAANEDAVRGASPLSADVFRRAYKNAIDVVAAGYVATVRTHSTV
jgi:hypothetical protein